jgi:NhaP-type Na+/H+ or K+/H+ antiporter
MKGSDKQMDSDWFRVETEEDSLQPTIDILLNLSIFFYFGAVIPWTDLSNTPQRVPLYSLVAISILILTFRRLPAILAMHRRIPAIAGLRQAIFAGYFGPIGVSAIFYLCVLVEYTDGLNSPIVEEGLALRLKETAILVVWFLVVSSVIAHGVAVPIIMVCLKPAPQPAETDHRIVGRQVGFVMSTKDFPLQWKRVSHGPRKLSASSCIAT